MEIYQFLLRHTRTITQELPTEKWVYYSEEIWEDDLWNTKGYQKKLQHGEDLGTRMKNAFEEGFQMGFEKIVIIGSDMYDLSQEDLQRAFEHLDQHDFVVGPAEDGGYYLLGMKRLKECLFEGKNWGNDTVLQSTLNDLKGEKHLLLETRNDVDHYEDIVNIKAFQPFLKHMKR